MNKYLLFVGSLLGAVAGGIGSAQAQDAQALYNSKACVACHKVDMRLVGPSYKEIAAKYAGQEGAAAVLAARMKQGSQGVWGPIPMPPNALTDEEARILAEWILQQ
ncbi:cytochrome c [Azomonas agilis]|uniref:Cytochrome c-551 n=1 Tax=Azomonas agilis TaxID=116849 RepID=A0A562HZT6_9GAMM|nr:c-type cytochrome [Azomonas agilis]TWH64307.1 cytochrome c [Azomonas agilis]